MTLESISPASAAPNWPGDRVVDVILTVPDLTVSGVAIDVAGSGITVSDINALPSGTRIEAKFTIAPNATVGDHDVTVRTELGEQSNALPFSVLHIPTPTVANVAPISGAVDTPNNRVVPFVIQGTNFSDLSSVQISGGDVAVAVNRVLPTEIRGTFTIASNAAIGVRDVTVTNTIGSTTGGGGVRVSTPAPFVVTAVGGDSPVLPRFDPTPARHVGPVLWARGFKR